VQGTGLGLNIVKRYAELLHGSIGFSSTQQEGTLFVLHFPVFKQEEI
jgi:signal transduction histidine kinase